MRDPLTFCNWLDALNTSLGGVPPNSTDWTTVISNLTDVLHSAGRLPGSLLPSE